MGRRPPSPSTTAKKHLTLKTDRTSVRSLAKTPFHVKNYTVKISAFLVQFIGSMTLKLPFNAVQMTRAYGVAPPMVPHNDKFTLQKNYIKNSASANPQQITPQ